MRLLTRPVDYAGLNDTITNTSGDLDRFIIATDDGWHDTFRGDLRRAAAVWCGVAVPLVATVTVTWFTDLVIVYAVTAGLLALWLAAGAGLLLWLERIERAHVLICPGNPMNRPNPEE
jgi:hypothetical protein